MAEPTARLAQLASSVGDDLMVIESERRQDQGTAAWARNRLRHALAWHDRAGGLQQHGGGVPGPRAQRRLRRMGGDLRKAKRGGSASTSVWRFVGGQQAMNRRIHQEDGWHPTD
jgi:hypothetical protein